MVTGPPGHGREVMAIVNITDNSMSGDGLLASASWQESVARACVAAVEDGAAILDLGAQASYAGAPVVPEQDEIDRIARAVAVARDAAGSSACLSVDSHRPRVVAAAFEAGATIANSIWGIRTPDGGWNDDLAAIVRGTKGRLVVCSNRGGAAAVSEFGPQWARWSGSTYDDLLREVSVDLIQQISRAVDVGVDPSQIVVDPGLGMGKTPEQSLRILAHFERFTAFGFPTLVAASRKVFLGLPTGRPPAERDHATVATTVVAAAAGASMFRVHNVRATVDALAVLDVLARSRAGTLVLAK